MPFFVYLLECRDGSFYCGYTKDLAKRLIKHNSGTASKYTRARLPVRMVYSEEIESRSSALKRELAVKRLSRKAKELLVNKSVKG